MTSDSNKKTSFDPFKQLELLKIKCKSLNAEIYKINAYYLQLIRSILPVVVKEAIFQIILLNQHNPELLTQNNTKESFQNKVDKILSDYISFLTIENLIIFSSNLEKDDLIGTQEKTLPVKNSKDSLEFFPLSDNSYITKSIELSLSIPTQNEIDLENWDMPINSNSSYDFSSEVEDDMSEEIECEEEGNISSDFDKDHLDSKIEPKDQDILKSIFMMAGEIISPMRKSVQSKKKNSVDVKDIDEIDENSNDNLLPQSPDELIRWTFSVEAALIRRLRNLSHLINIELLRVGLINSYIPQNLLDAAISGQLNSVHAPSNILKLRLPVAPTSNNEIDISCLLVRLSELEFDHLKLRQCRQKLIQQRNILLKMIRQQQYWQSRSLAKEVREQWWKNTQKNQA